MIPAVGLHVYVICVMDMAVFVKINHLKEISETKKGKLREILKLLLDRLNLDLRINFYPQPKSCLVFPTVTFLLGFHFF